MNTNWILNEDGSIYHLKLHPGELATTILTVGDPERVNKIASYFDKIETNKQSREFRSVTGYLSGRHISVISTGIGTDNVDIVFNEIDALFNIDLKDGKSNTKLTTLNFIRIGTSGAIQPEIPLNSLLATRWSIGMDGLLPFYSSSSHCIELPNELKEQLPGISQAFKFSCHHELLQKFSDDRLLTGNTMTASGFYVPQGRMTRVRHIEMLPIIGKWNIADVGKISNIEMETSAIYLLSSMMGHRAISISAILANRITGEFSKSPEKTITELIEFALEKILILDD